MSQIVSGILNFDESGSHPYLIVRISSAGTS